MLIPQILILTALYLIPIQETPTNHLVYGSIAFVRMEVMVMETSVFS